ncbi:MAG TPA: M48 family metallopeptidase [Thermodesulfobacteriota bacterium]|nr:M48 family metallopeptidase [Thermodesulfobacteriota bacterium]
MESAGRALIIIYFMMLAFGYALERANINRLRQRASGLPEELDREIDSDRLAAAEAYTAEKTRFGIAASVFNNAVTLFFLFCGPLVWYDRWIASLGLGFIPSGVLFIVILSVAGSVLNIPFSLYGTFVIEKRYGFNTSTPVLWITDALKGLVISTVLLAAAAGASLWIYRASPHLWWLWLWVFYLGLSIFLIYLSPYLIEPLFNRFDPLGDAALEESIREVAGKAGIKVSRVFKMDASKRTAHTNAYFTGIGHVKRIVLYDTLLQKLSGKEIVAVLAHEIGHWKRRHLLKGILVTEAAALIALYLAYLLLGLDVPNRLFGIEGSLFTAVVMLAFLATIAGFPFSPLFAWISRRHEREADRSSYELTGEVLPMIGALVKLSRDNLSNLNPHPLYVAFHYSHPPVAERIKYLKRLRGGRRRGLT